MSNGIKLVFQPYAGSDTDFEKNAPSFEKVFGGDKWSFYSDKDSKMNFALRLGGGIKLDHRLSSNTEVLEYGKEASTITKTVIETVSISYNLKPSSMDDDRLRRILSRILIDCAAGDLKLACNIQVYNLEADRSGNETKRLLGSFNNVNFHNERPDPSYKKMIHYATTSVCCGPFTLKMYDIFNLMRETRKMLIPDCDTKLPEPDLTKMFATLASAGVLPVVGFSLNLENKSVDNSQRGFF